MSVKQQRFTVQTAGNGWVIINRAKGIYPRCVFSTAMSSLPANEHDLKQWVFGLICRLWWDVTDSSGYQGAMADAEDIAAKIVRYREAQP